MHTSKYKYNHFIEKFGITQMQNLALLNNLIKECDLSKIISSSVNINTAVNNFINKYKSILRKCLPEKKCYHGFK